MYKTIGFLICVFALLSCSKISETEKQETEFFETELVETSPELKTIAKIPAEPITVQPYDAFLNSVVTSEKSAANLFKYLDQDMPAFWDATTWDFYGMSRVPGEGEIACGYFVTTLLRDLGFDIDRVRLAQEPSGVMIEELTVNIHKSNSLQNTLDVIKNGPNNAIYIIGLDFHTGFISHSDTGTFFIHSNYIDRTGVVREDAATSEALSHSNFFMIDNLTANPKFLAIW